MISSSIRAIRGSPLRYHEAPKVAHAGDTFHTHCEWQNTTAKTLAFPDEMCTGVGFYFPSQGQIACTEGSWPTTK